VLDRLFEPGDVRGAGIELRLHPVERVGSLDLGFAKTGLARFDFAQAGDFGFEFVGALAGERTTRRTLGFEGAGTRAQQFRLRHAFLGLEGLIPFSGPRLALQMSELLVELVTNVAQPFEVLIGMLHAVLGFAAALLVFGNAGRLFEKGAQFFGPRLDDARNHALFDDRVAARAEAGAEEDVGDVLAPAARPVQEIGRYTVACYRALDRDLSETRVLPTDSAVGIVEHDFDHGLSDRFARVGSAEDDIGHRFAAQVLGRTFAHDPDQGVDDIGLAATVRTDDAGEVARERQRGGIDEGFEA